MNVLMIGVDKTSLGGMLTVVENYKQSEKFCKATNLLYIPVVTHANKISKLLFFLRAYLKIIIIFISKEIDIVHVHMSSKGSAYREGVILLTAKIFHKKTLAHMHAAEYEKWFYSLGYMNKKIVSFLLKKADVILALGEKWRKVYEDVTGCKSKVEILYNAVNVPRENYYNADAKEILFLAHMIERKGIDDLLDSISAIGNDIPDDIVFVLYGADRENNIIEKICDRKLSTKVKYKGWLSNDEKDNCFKNVMLNVLPSYNEGLPMTILETMAYGIPNISTQIAAIPEVIRNGENGILIMPGDKKRLSEKLKNIISDREMRLSMSDKAYNTIVDKFSINNHLTNLMKIYEDLKSDE